MKLLNYKDKNDLEEIEKLLYEEYIVNGMNRGFWNNIEIIRENLKHLKIIKEKAQFIGFCLMQKDNITPSIIWLKTENRKQGIGKKLISQLEKKAKKKEKKYMTVIVIDESIQFWSKLGYKFEINTDKMIKLL